jgi:hypothetical protein
MKTCTKCKIEKNESEFSKDKHKKSGRVSQCKKCINLRQNLKNSNNREKAREYSRIWRLKNLESERKRYRDRYWENPKLSREKNKKKRDRENPILRKLKQNHPKVLERRREIHRIRKEKDIMYRLAKTLRARLNNFLKATGYKKIGSAIKDIGCTSDFLKNYLESKFQPGMTWENWSSNGWHVDHIVPLSSAKTPEDMIKLCHYTNLQPLWAADNLKKGSRV